MKGWVFNYEFKVFSIDFVELVFRNLLNLVWAVLFGEKVETFNFF